MTNEEMIVGYWIKKSKERMEGAKPLFVLAEVEYEEKKNEI